MAAGLGLKTTAEGVEHEGLSTLLSTEGCLDAQGYHFAKPLPLAHFLAFLAGQSG
jgi:sensor c-di-GMP phosphodiesterase-like protein